MSNGSSNHSQDHRGYNRVFRREPFAFRWSLGAERPPRAKGDAHFKPCSALQEDQGARASHRASCHTCKAKAHLFCCLGDARSQPLALRTIHGSSTTTDQAQAADQSSARQRVKHGWDNTKQRTSQCVAPERSRNLQPPTTSAPHARHKKGHVCSTHLPAQS